MPPGGLLRFRCNFYAIGAQVGDLPGFVEPLGDLHRAFRGQPQPAAGRLLQGAGRKGRLRVAHLVVLHNLPDPESRLLHPGHQFLDLLAAEAFDLLSLDHRQAGIELDLTGSQVSVQRPVGFRRKSRDLLFALDHQAQAGALHPACRITPIQGFASQRRNQVTHQPIHDAARLLRFDQVHVHRAWRSQGRLHRALGDRGKRHAVHRFIRRQCS